MSTTLPEIVDPWRMITARRSFHGTLPQARMMRLAPSLANAQAQVSYNLEFGTDPLGVPYLHVQAEAPLTLICQRSLDEFVLPLRIDTRLGLIRKEQEEAGLPATYEPLLVVDGQLALKDVIEDELILALPLIPIKPGSELSQQPDRDTEAEVGESRANPFALLSQLKKS